MRERADAYRPHMCSPSLQVAGGPWGGSRLRNDVGMTTWHPLNRKPGVAGVGLAGWAMIVAVHSQVEPLSNIRTGTTSVRSLKSAEFFQQLSLKKLRADAYPCPRPPAQCRCPARPGAAGLGSLAG